MTWFRWAPSSPEACSKFSNLQFGVWCSSSLLLLTGSFQNVSHSTCSTKPRKVTECAEPTWIHHSIIPWSWCLKITDFSWTQQIFTDCICSQARFKCWLPRISANYPPSSARRSRKLKAALGLIAQKEGLGYDWAFYVLTADNFQ